jgi:hypothetical protein
MGYTFFYRVKGQEGRRTFYTDTLPYTCHGEPSIAEQIVYQLQYEDRIHGEPERDYELDFVREYTPSREVGIVTLRVVEVSRAYGGPEEGGWYYDYESLLREFTVPKAKAARLRERLEKYADRCNEHRRWDEKIRVLTGPWQPAERPHYC